MERDYLFVYGSLRPAADNTSLIPGAYATRAALEASSYIGPAQVPGRLVSLGAYPGLILDNSGSEAQGDLFQVCSADILPLLDVYEGCSEQCPQPHEYRRVRADVMLLSGQRVTAWLYEWTGEELERSGSRRGEPPAVPGNDWLRCGKTGH